MDTAERRVVAALWSLQGIGPRTIEQLREAVGDLGQLLAVPVLSWREVIPWATAAFEAISQVERLDLVADAVEAKVRRFRYEIAFPGDPAFPESLINIPNPPPLLFVKGPGARAPPRRRLAMVGCRRPDNGFLGDATALAKQVARAGIGVVSGAADGVDQACHRGALAEDGETWAFLGCAIEEMDPPQASLIPEFEAHQGTFFSEYPPGTRSEKATFPRRNRLIAGAAQATLVLRAGAKSGALYTAHAALDQRRPVLAMPGDASNELALGCNLLIKKGLAGMCLGVGDVLEAVGLRREAPVPAAKRVAPPADGLTGVNRLVLEKLDEHPRTFDEVVELTGVPSGVLVSALMELELGGFLVQKPGRRFEKT